MRTARPDEYDAAGEVTVDAYREYAEAIGPEHWREYRADLANVARRAERGEILVAEIDGALVGAVSFYPPTFDAGLAAARDWWWPADFAYLRALGVHPDARGRGVGRALTLACIDRARQAGAAGIALDTTSVMPVAQAMYEHLGFTRVQSSLPDEPGTEFHLYSYRLRLGEGTEPPREA